jgi:RAT1-interacting protein
MGDFDKKCPTFQRPVEIGQMSLDQERRLKPNSSLLKYFCPVNPTTVKMDLSVGFKTYVPKPSRPEEGISPILQWVTTSPEAFLPGAKNRGSQTSQTVPSSPVGAKKKNIISPLAQSEKFSANGSTRATSSSTTTTDSTSEKKTKRPDNLHTNFITWRGMITRIACTPYDHTPWKMAVTKYKGTIYFRELETEEAVRRKASETDKERRMCYWGVKFEDYLTSSTPVASTRAVSSQRGWKEGPANDKEDYCSVVRTKINQHSIVMAGEVDCCEHGARDGGPSSYIELKTSRIIYTDKNKYSFKRYKLLKWWAQSFLIGVPKIVCGFRDDDGIVKKLETFRTLDIPKQIQDERNMWDPAICLNFLDQFLTWVKEIVTKDNPRVCVIVEWNKPFSHITAYEHTEGSGYTVLPDWYLEEQSTDSTPSSPTPTPSATERTSTVSNKVIPLDSQRGKIAQPHI